MTTDTKWCSRCKDTPAGDAHANYCRACWNSYQREYKKRRYHSEPAYRQKAIGYVRRSLYGISDERYTELWAQQGGVCAICLLDDDKRDLHVDHCHETGKIRGLLCSKCNGALGMFKENLSLLFRAADYLVLHG